MNFEQFLSIISYKLQRIEWSRSYLGQGQAVILVNSPRSTQPIEQCTPHFRLKSFSLLALAVHVGKSQEMSDLKAISWIQTWFSVLRWSLRCLRFVILNLLWKQLSFGTPGVKIGSLEALEKKIWARPNFGPVHTIRGRSVATENIFFRDFQLRKPRMVLNWP